MRDVWGFDFDSLSNQGWSGVASRDSSVKRTGTHSLSTGGVGVNSPSFSNVSSIYVGFAVNLTSLSGTVHTIISLMDGGTQQITITRETDGSIKIRRGGVAGTVLGSSAAGVLNVAGVFFHVQVFASIHSSAGSAEVRVEGATVASASGVNTNNSGVAQVNALQLVGPSGSDTIKFDDLWVDDSSFLGDMKIETLFPSANGANNNFTANGAANAYQCCDETPANDDTDYASSGTVNDKQTFALTNLLSTVGQVKAVKITHRSRKDDVGARTVAPLLITQSVESQRATVSLSTSYGTFSEVLINDPADSNPFTISNLNAAEVGMKIIS